MSCAAGLIWFVSGGINRKLNCWSSEQSEAWLDRLGLLYVLLVHRDDGTTTVQMEANSKEEGLESGQELYPGCRLALVNPVPGEHKA